MRLNEGKMSSNVNKPFDHICVKSSVKTETEIKEKSQDDGPIMH